MKKRFIAVGIIIGVVCFSLTASLFAQVTIVKGKSGNDFVTEAKKHVPSISVKTAKGIYDADKNTLFVDVRDYLEYAQQGYIFRSLDLPSGKVIFDVKSRIPHKDTPLIVYCKKGKRSTLAAWDLVQMGYTNVKYMEGGILRWKKEGYPVLNSPYIGVIDMPAGKTPEDFVKEAKAAVGEGISPAEANKRKEADPKTVILDVATKREHAALGSKIPGAILTSQGEIIFTDFMKNTAPDANTPIITTCTAGKRGTLIAKILKDMGYKNVTYIDGGLGAWKKAGLPLENYSGE